MSADPQAELARLREKLAKLETGELAGYDTPEKQALRWQITQLKERVEGRPA